MKEKKETYGPGIKSEGGGLPMGQDESTSLCGYSQQKVKPSSIYIPTSGRDSFGHLTSWELNFLLVSYFSSQFPSYNSLVASNKSHFKGLCFQ